MKINPIRVYRVTVCVVEQLLAMLHSDAFEEQTPAHVGIAVTCDNQFSSWGKRVEVYPASDAVHGRDAVRG